MKRRIFLRGLSKAGLLSFLPISHLFARKHIISPGETGTNGFQTEPYLQNMAFDGVTVMWLSSGNHLGWVEITDGQSERKIYSATNGLIQANARINKIRLDKLKPGTSYQYRVFSKEIKDFRPYKVIYGKTDQKGPYSFTTPAEDADQVNFVVFNDLHDHPDNIPELLGACTQKGEYDFVVFNGDSFDWIDGEARIVKDLLAPCAKAFSTTSPFIAVQGNHEVRGKYARQFFDYFDYPEDRCYNAFTWGPVRFIVLDSGEDKEDDHAEYSGLVSFDPYREEQARWLAREIESKEFRRAAFRVVFIHIPVYHSGDRHGTLHCRKLFNPLLNKGKIDLAISGHTHRYGTFDPDPETHNYPIVIGGGPGFAGRGGGPKTLIKVRATNKDLSLRMLTDGGKVVGSYDLKKA